MVDAFDSLSKMLDELGGRAMLVEDDEPELVRFRKSLAELSERAESAGCDVLARGALELSCSGTSADSIRQGLLHLQSALDQSTPQTTQAAGGISEFPSIAHDPELISDFIVEASDHLANVETQVLALEQNPADKEAVHAIFRGFHTIKGLAGFLELPAIQRVAHEVETLLDQVRNGQLAITPEMADVILAGADYLKTDIVRLQRVLSGSKEEVSASGDGLIARVHALMSLEPSAPSKAIEVESASNTPVQEKAPAETKATESRLVKVDTDKLDFLVDMVGELVIAQSILRHDGELSWASNPQLGRNLAQLARITGEVQKTAMSMRMVAVGQLLQKSVRLVRDLTRKSGKRAEVEIVGEDTELDRTIVDDLSDPLIHMIRNAADHGIETPEERVKAGKSPVARIGLKAYHQSGHIVIEISDDGRGLMRDKILKKAQERGLIQDGTHLHDKEVFNLIFEPGFSTADKITDVSGRGVGMDVVRRQIQKMRGRIDIESQPGRGTTFFLKLPLTLAIIDGLVVGVGVERFIVPIFAVKEIFRPQADTVFTVEGRNEMILVRGKLMPAVRLHRRFGIAPRSENIAESVVVVAESGGRCFCLVVDELMGKQEVVIKSLGETFKGVAGVAGGAILGDGRVGLIVDTEGIFGEGARA
jgi:two-component system, chemotaxis family, sensor kinase CheA